MNEAMRHNLLIHLLFVFDMQTSIKVWCIYKYKIFLEFLFKIIKIITCSYT